MSDRYRIHHGDCLDFLKKEPANSLDAIVTDPPGAIGFMGRDWDKDRGGRREWTRYWSKRFRAALRVLKPGAHAFVWALPRTSHFTGCALADAGFEIRDAISHTFGSGMPKSHNLGEGRGTALKPAHEIWFLVRKPFKGTLAANVAKWGTGAINIDATRVAHAGAADRAAHDAQVAAIKARGGSMEGSWKNSSDLSGANDVNDAGRWPPNVLLSHSASCERIGTREVKANPTWDTPNRKPPTIFGTDVANVSGTRHASADGTEEAAVWYCAEDCPVRLMDHQSGERAAGNHPAHRAGLGFGSTSHGTENDHRATDAGTASRYFPQLEWSDLDDLEPFIYAAKASRAERDFGLEHFRRASAQTNVPNPNGVNAGVRNTHPTVKSVDFARYLVRMVAPRGVVRARVGDFCMGSGTVGVASILEGCEFLGCELNDTDEEPFFSIAKARIEHALGYTFIPRESLRSPVPPPQRGLFDRETA